MYERSEPLTSTPGAEQEPFGSPGSPIMDGDRFTFLPTARNVGRNNHVARDIPVPEEPVPRTSARWSQNPELLVKCVDDHVQALQLNMETGVT